MDQREQSRHGTELSRLSGEFVLYCAGRQHFLFQLLSIERNDIALGAGKRSFLETSEYNQSFVSEYEVDNFSSHLCHD